MPIRAAFLEAAPSPCAYLAGREALAEELLVQKIDDDLFSNLIESGYRHFGRFFFRPCCAGCHACIPIRVPAADFRFPRSARKLFHRNADLTVDIVRPKATPEAFALYLDHKTRFVDTPVPEAEPDYERFAETFFHPFPFSYALRVRDGEKLVCMSHFDLTERVLSNVYCYYDQAYLSRSPGRFAIYRLVELAQSRGVPYVYLGFYLHGHPHMSYKRDIRPNELLLTEGAWVPFTDERNQSVLPETFVRRGFIPRCHLVPANHRETEAS
jgi:arginine-tRNA-protein transferase